MEPHAPEPLADRETRAELRASVAARRELGPEMEDQVIEAFLARIEQRVQAQVAQQMSAARPVRPKKGKSNDNPTEIVGASFGIAVPLMVVAGIWGQAPGIIAVVAMVLLINAMYLFGKRE
jgi:hypothetical protein